MIVNKMEEGWVPAAAELEARLFSHPWSEEDFKNSLPDPNRAFFACTIAGSFAGYCGLQWAAEQGEILTIGVDPDLRRSGAGSRLMEALLEECRLQGVEELFLEVRKGNLPAIGLYEKFGFAPISVRKNYYSDPEEDGIVYRLEVLK